MEAKLSFWDFSLKFYADTGTSQVCLELQDTFSVDVNTLLFALWCAYRFRRLSHDELALVIQSTRSWQSDVVRPLRQVRRWLKQQDFNVALDDAIAKLRKAVKHDELDAERIQQLTMAARFSDLGEVSADGPSTAENNLRVYQDLLGVEFPADQKSILLSRLPRVPGYRP
jgi:uncharacterized protein (TIGR02444 family)